MLQPFSDLTLTSATTGSSVGGGLLQFLPFIGIIAIFYFFILRPQQKKEKQRQEMVGALKRGDRVLTTGGIIGTVHKVLGGGEILLEVAEDTRIRILAGAITQTLAKTTEPHPATKDEKGPLDPVTDGKKDAAPSRSKKASKPAVRKPSKEKHEVVKK